MKDKFQTTNFFSCINLQQEKVEKYLEIKSV